MKTKALISFAVPVKLICVFVFAYADCWFSHVSAQMFPFGAIVVLTENCLFVQCLKSLFLKYRGPQGRLDLTN